MSATSITGTGHGAANDGNSAVAEKIESKIIAIHQTIDALETISDETQESLADHLEAADPHGDRAYASGLVTTHTGASDPHGDRAYASGLVTTHTGAADPHGDRAYTNNILSLAGLASYEGTIASNAGIQCAFSSSNKQIMTRSFHTCREDITSLKVGVANWYVDTQNGSDGAGVERGTGASASVKVAIEYPLGATPVLVNWSGVTTGTIADGATGISDSYTVTIKKGERFAVRMFFHSTGGIPFSGYYQVQSGEGAEYGVTTTDKTTSGTVGANGVIALPCLLIGTTNKPSIMLIGDSRMMGPETAEDSGDRGEAAKSVGPFFAYGNYGVPTDRLTWMTNNFTKRAALANYYTHAIISAGINDYTNGSRTDTNTTADLISLLALLPSSMPKYVTTILPATNSSDSWASNQSIQNSTHNNYRIAENKKRRTGVKGAAGCFDVADLLESSRDSGLYVTAAYVADGVHLTLAAQRILQRSRIIDPGVFNRLK